MWRNGGKYRELASRVVAIDTEIAMNKNRPKEISRLKRERNVAMIEMERNPLHTFMEQGLMSSIVEDTNVNDEDTGYQSSLDKKIAEYTDNITFDVIKVLDFSIYEISLKSPAFC